MASTLLPTTTSAKSSIEGTGVYIVHDTQKGVKLLDFYNNGYHTKSPRGLGFIAEISHKDQTLWQVICSIISCPHWGFLRLYTTILPPDYAWFFHNREAEAAHTLILQLWTPKSTCVYYEGSSLRYVHAEESTEWGLLRKHRSHMKIEGVSEKIVPMIEGGYAIIDSRVGWTILEGIVLNIGFVTAGELRFWGKMELPDREELRAKVAELEADGLRSNFAFIAPNS